MSLHLNPRCVAIAIALTSLVFPATAPAADTWTRWNASPTKAKIRSIDFTTPNTLFGGSDGDGVFNTTSGVLGPWSLKNSGLDPQQGELQINQVYASGGSVYAATSGGLFKSASPTGDNWQPLGQTAGEPKQIPGAVNSVYVVGQRIVAGVVSAGFFFSDDGGAHWTKAAGTPVAESPFHITASAAVLLAASSSGVYASFDNGSSWQLRSDGLPFGTVYRLAVDPAPGSTKVYALLSGSVHKTSVANIAQGVLWTDATGTPGDPDADDGVPGQLRQPRSLLLTPTAWGPTRYLAGTSSGVFATVDDGATWSKMSGTSTVNEATVNAFGDQEVQALGFGFSPISIMAGTSAAGIYATIPEPLAKPNNAAGIITPNVTPKVGDTLTAPKGTFTGAKPLFLAFAWKRCTNSAMTQNCEDNIDRGEKHVVNDDDKDKYLNVTVTARNISNPSSLSQVSNTTAEVDPPPGTAPAVWNNQFPTVTPSASLVYGQTYTANKGKWRSGAVTDIPVTATYQWERCLANGSSCVPILDADESQYTSTTADINRIVRVQMTVTNNSYGTTAPEPIAVGLIYGKAATNTAKPQVIGEPYIGEKLSSTVGDWKGIKPTFKRRWFRCETGGQDTFQCNPINGQTGPDYTLTEADRNKRVEVEIESDDYDEITHRTAKAFSVVTPIIGDRPVDPGPPVVNPPVVNPPVVNPPVVNPPVVTPPTAPKVLSLSAPKKLKVGAALAAPKSVKGFKKLSFQWQRNGKAIKKATAATYKLTKADRGKTIRCRVTLTPPTGKALVRYTKAIKVSKKLK